MVIGYPPGTTRCDWCHKALAWKDSKMTHDNEALCPMCWPSWLAITAEWGPDSAAQELEMGPR